MIFKQQFEPDLAHASYFIGDEEAGTAAAADPQRDITAYEAEAGRHGMQIQHAIFTHYHADFVAGQLELRSC